MATKPIAPVNRAQISVLAIYGNPAAFPPIALVPYSAWVSVIAWLIVWPKDAAGLWVAGIVRTGIVVIANLWIT